MRRLTLIYSEVKTQKMLSNVCTFVNVFSWVNPLSSVFTSPSTTAPSPNIYRGSRRPELFVLGGWKPRRDVWDYLTKQRILTTSAKLKLSTVKERVPLVAGTLELGYVFLILG